MANNTDSVANLDSEEVPLIAAIVNHEEVEFEQLLEKGADVNEKNALGGSPLYWAACVGRVDWITILLDLGADINATTKEEETALHFAAQCGRAKAVSLLLDRGADVRASDARGRTALHSAVEEGEDTYEVVSLLIEKGADVQATDIDGRTALDCTHGLKQENIVSLLKQKEEWV
jgi:ankyrin repeat protein